MLEGENDTFENFQVIDNVKETINGPVIETEIIFNKYLDENIMKELLDITDNEEFYNDTATVTTDYLFQYFNQIQSRVEAGNVSLIPLCFYMSDKFKEKLNQFTKMNEDGKTNFQNLSNIFTIGSRFVSEINGQLVGSVVHNTEVTSSPFGERFFVVTGLLTKSKGKEYVQTQQNFYIPQFGGLRHIKDLNVRPMTDEDYQKLTERGNKFVKYGIGTQYASYNGEMFRETQYGPVHFVATGRIMVDPVGFSTINPNYSKSSHQQQHQQQSSITEIPEDLRFMMYPFTTGFSFVAKQWGEIYVENISEIKFDDNAFDVLVLNEDLKEVAKALVTNAHVGFKDVITGKSGGCIFLLHGPPGVGKTLTCEAISELLHKPLYSITVGELGTTTEKLEQQLSTILEIANSWDAVILIDEADIFLEKRSDNDINRNAMVGIFLRLLERHTGVLFLTTNRANKLDEAFRSRISVIIEYQNFDNNTRKQIWKNLLNAANIKLEEDVIDQLTDLKTPDGLEINGRQIKNAIRMAQCLAFNKNATVNFDYLSKVIKMM